MLEGHGSARRLSRLQRGFRGLGPRRRRRFRGGAVGLVSIGILIGAGSFAVLDGAEPHTPGVAGAYYANCRDAVLAGAAPIYRGQPGYRPQLDADDDGIACEPWRPR